MVKVYITKCVLSFILMVIIVREIDFFSIDMSYCLCASKIIFHSYDLNLEASTTGTNKNLTLISNVHAY